MTNSYSYKHNTKSPIILKNTLGRIRIDNDLLKIYSYNLITFFKLIIRFFKFLVISIIFYTHNPIK